jgi:hypothetical protein
MIDAGTAGLASDFTNKDSAERTIQLSDYKWRL